jgi:hypothetical protein
VINVPAHGTKVVVGEPIETIAGGNEGDSTTNTVVVEATAGESGQNLMMLLVAKASAMLVLMVALSPIVTMTWAREITQTALTPNAETVDVLKMSAQVTVGGTYSVASKVIARVVKSRTASPTTTGAALTHASWKVRGILAVEK